MTETERIRSLAKLAGQTPCDICDRALSEHEQVKRRTACGIMDFCLECYGDVYGADALVQLWDVRRLIESFGRKPCPAEGTEAAA